MHCSGSCETQTDRKSYLLEARCKNYPHLSNSSRSEVGARRDVDPTAAVDMVSRRRLLVGRPKKTPTEFFSGATPVSICFRWVPANLCSVNRGAPKFFFFSWASIHFPLPCRCTIVQREQREDGLIN